MNDNETTERHAHAPRTFITAANELTPEQREAAEAVVKHLASGGLRISLDEAQLMSNLANFGDHALAKSKQLRTPAVRELIAGKTARAQACLAVLAKGTATQHRLVGEVDVNLRALAMLDTILAVLTAFTQPQKLKHPRG